MTLRVAALAGVLSAALASQSLPTTPPIHTVFIVVMENQVWSEIKGSPQAPFINNTLLPAAAHAEHYLGVPFLHPSLPNYLVLEAGSNFGITDDDPPSTHHWSTHQHLTAGVEAAGLTWHAWVENIDGQSCPLTVDPTGLYTYAVNPTVYFDDVIANAANCIAHERPLRELATALAANDVPNLNWIIPNLCDDAHSCPLSTGDQWLSSVIPMIQASEAYQQGGAIFITWDEDDTGEEDQPLGLILISPAARAGYSNTVTYTHDSTLRTIEELLRLQPFYAGAAAANDLSDLFNTAAVSLSPPSLSFAPQALGTVSAPMNLTLRNQGDAAVAIQSIAASRNYGETNDCGLDLAAEAACTISVVFQPDRLGPETGAITVMDSAPGSPHTAQLSGEGLGGAVTLSTLDLDFGAAPVGHASNPLQVQVTNSGSAALTLSSIAVTGPFAATNNCGAALAAGHSCTITVEFQPTGPVSADGTLTLTDNAADTPQRVALHGLGQGAIAVLSAETLSFGTTAVGTSSPAQRLSLQNAGNIALALTSVALTPADGPFALINPCTAALAPSAQCTVTLRFTPSAPGTATAMLRFSDTAPDAPQTVALSGTGLGAVARLSATTLQFGAQPLGAAAPTQAVTLMNAGNAPLAITSVLLQGGNGAYALSQNCGSSLAAGAACTASVTFTPGQIGAANAALVFTDAGAASPQSVALSGTGLGALAQLSASALAFGPVAVGGTAPAQAVTLMNAGNAPLGIASVTLTGNSAYRLSQNCGSSLAAGAACTASVTFMPTQIGAANATLVFTDAGAASPQSVALSGTGLGALAQLSASALQFGSQPVGVAAPAKTVTLQNGGNAPLGIALVAVQGGGGAFSLSHNCGSSLAAGGSCIATVGFSPTQPGETQAALVFTLSGGNSPQTVALDGTGLGAVAAVATAVDFGAELSGTVSAAKALTLMNTGNAPLVVASALVTGDFQVSAAACATPLAPGSGCTVTLSFAPTRSGPESGSLQITDNAGVQTVTLTGQGTDFSLAPGFDAASWNVAAGQPATGTIQLSSVNGFTDDRVTLTCGALRLPSATCTVLPAWLALPANGQATARVLIETAAAAPPLGSGGWPAELAVLALASLLALPRRRARRMLALGSLLAGLAACGGSPTPSAPTVAPGSYTVSLVATASGGATRTLPLQLRIR